MKKQRRSLYNLALEHLVLPIGDLVFRSQYIRSLRLARHIVSQPEEDIHTYQATRLQQLLLHATRNSSFYRSLGIDFQPDPYLWLKEFPQLSKPTLRSHSHRLLTRPLDGLIKLSTSGSSGIQSHTYVSKEELSQIRSVQTLWWEFAGYVIGDPVLQTGITVNRSLEKRLKDFFFRTYYLNAFLLSRPQVEKTFS
jgi:phenylacetate-CoA ligase